MLIYTGCLELQPLHGYTPSEFHAFPPIYYPCYVGAVPGLLVYNIPDPILWVTISVNGGQFLLLLSLDIIQEHAGSL